MNLYVEIVCGALQKARQAPVSVVVVVAVVAAAVVICNRFSTNAQSSK